MIEDGKTVTLEYTLKIDDGSTVDTNVGGEPLVYEHGQGQILPALERELAGLGAGDTKQVQLSAEDGYGVIDPDAFQEVELDSVPEGAREKGQELIAEDDQGNRRVIRVHEVQADKVVIDLNHPLAGEALHFDLKVVAVD